MKSKLLPVIVIILFIGLVSQAGVKMVTDHKSFNKRGSDSTNTFYIQNGMIRVENKSSENKTVLIFRGNKDLLWVINSGQGTYQEITKQDLKKIEKRMEKMRKKMKDAPPKVKKMMKQKMPNIESQAEIVYEKTGSGIKVNKWTCDKYKGIREGSLERKVWSTSWTSMDLSSDYADALEKFNDFFGVLSSGHGNLFGVSSSEKSNVKNAPKGISIKTVNYRDDEKSSETQLKKIQKKEFSASLFELPDGLEKVDKL